MIKIFDSLQHVTRLIIKQQKIVCAGYHLSSIICAEDKSLAVTREEKIKLVDKKTQEEKLKKYEISMDIMSPPSPDEEMPNTGDPNNPIDLRSIPRIHKVSTISIKFTEKAESMFLSLSDKPKNINTFREASLLYLQKEGVYHRGMVEFVEVALKKMKEFNCVKDLKAYKILLTAFPKHRMKSTNPFQAEFMRYPKQQDCAIDLIEKMDENGVMPDEEFGNMLEDIFGNNSFAMRKLQRTMYWMPKFRYANPYPIPVILTDNPIELAQLALRRMSFDIKTQISVWNTKDLREVQTNLDDTSIIQFETNTQEEQHDENESASENELIYTYEKDALMTRPERVRQFEDTFIVSAQSPEQSEFIERLPTDKAVFVEGPFMVWLRGKQQKYFILRAESKPPEEKEEIDEYDQELFEFTTYFEEEQPTCIEPMKSVHEQEDGLILGMCITGTSSRDSLVSWIRQLQLNNPKLAQIPVVFTIRSEGLETSLVKLDGSQNQFSTS